MASRSMYGDTMSYDRGRFEAEGSFATDGSGDPTAAGQKITGCTVSRTGTGIYLFTWADNFESIKYAHMHSDDGTNAFAGGISTDGITSGTCHMTLRQSNDDVATSLASETIYCKFVFERKQA